MDFDLHTFEQPFTGTVNVCRVGDTLVDTGHFAEGPRGDFREALADGPLAGVERVVITHPHVDHVGGSQTLPEVAELSHVVYEGTESAIRGFNDYIRASRAELLERSAGLDVDEEAILDTHFPIGDYAEEDVHIDRVVGDGDAIRVGEYDCEVVHTPGHDKYHLAVWHEPSGVLLSADLVSVNGHFMYSPPYSDVGAYKRSLRRLRELEPDVLVPGHGEVMTDAPDRIEDAIEKAEGAEARVGAAVADADGFVSATDLAREAFGATEDSLRVLTQTAIEYLEYFDEQGDVDLEYREDGVFARSA